MKFPGVFGLAENLHKGSSLVINAQLTLRQVKSREILAGPRVTFLANAEWKNTANYKAEKPTNACPLLRIIT